VSIQLHIVARVTYQEKFTRGNIHFTVLSVVIVTLLLYKVLIVNLNYTRTTVVREITPVEIEA